MPGRGRVERGRTRREAASLDLGSARGEVARRVDQILLRADSSNDDELARRFLRQSLGEPDEGVESLLRLRKQEDGALGRSILEGASLEDLSRTVLDQGLEPQPVSGRQEALENLVNRYV